LPPDVSSRPACCATPAGPCSRPSASCAGTWRRSADGDAAKRTFLLADFHVCLAECSGNRLLTDVMRDLTARTTLVALLYQSSHDASQSCNDHAAIVDALAKGDTEKAEELMLAHIGSVQGALNESSATGNDDELSRLRASLTPLRLAKS
jgi:DNA-binding GntR family transcriptional regulator